MTWLAHVVIAALLAHALGGAVAGTLNPFAWPLMTVLVVFLFVLPCVALVLAVIDGAFDASPPTFSRRDRQR